VPRIAFPAVSGWTYPEQLQWLAQRAYDHRRIVEIGCWKGRSTIALAAGTRGIVYAVDSWKGSADRLDECNVFLAREGSDQVFREYTQNIAPYRNVTTFKMTSVDAWYQLRKSKFDFVYLDGDHDYEAVKWDISHWGGLLVKGGLLAGHDADIIGVKRAIKELVPHHKVVPSKDAMIWWWTDGSE